MTTNWAICSPFKLLGLILLLAAGASSAHALQQGQRLNGIEVLVNDEPISSFDINQRLRLVIAVAGGVSSQEEFLQVREQVIQSMVDERLQLQEAREFDLVVSDQELDQFFVRRAQSVGQSPEQFEQALTQIGASRKTMVDQINAEFTWSQLVRGRLGQFINVSDDEVEAYIQRLYDNQGKFEYRLGEIVLLVGDGAQAAAVRATATELTRQIRGGASFTEIAKQLSASSSSSIGGDLGWLTLDDLPDNVSAAIRATDIDAVTDPIRTPGGYLIMAVQDRRRILTPDPLDDQIELAQLFLATDDAGDVARKAAFTDGIEALRAGETSCDAIEEYGQQIGANERVKLGFLRIRDLRGESRDVVQELEFGEISRVMTMEDGLRSLVVCSRREAEVQAPDFDQVFDQLEQQRLSLLARRYLRDLRRDAIVDYR